MRQLIALFCYNFVYILSILLGSGKNVLNKCIKYIILVVFLLWSTHNSYGDSHLSPYLTLTVSQNL